MTEVTTLLSLFPKLPGELLNDPKTFATGDTPPHLLRPLPQVVLLLGAAFLRTGLAGIKHPSKLIQTLTRPQLLTGHSKLALIPNTAGKNRPAPLLLQEIPALTPEIPKLKSYRYLSPFKTMHPLRQLVTLVVKVPLGITLVLDEVFTLE